MLLRQLLTNCVAVGLLIFHLFGTSWAADPDSVPLSDKEIADYVHSGSYNRDLIHELALAKDYLDFRVNLNSRQKNHKKLAMVVAVDNTALADEPRLKELFVHLPMTKPDLWKTDEPVIWAFRAFYDYAVSKGVDVFFVTSRPEAMRRQTAHNLEREGYAGWKGLYMHPEISEQDEVREKETKRGEIEKEGYSIILNVGSRMNDVKGGHSSKVVLLPQPDSHSPRRLQGFNTLG